MVKKTLKVKRKKTAGSLFTFKKKSNKSLSKQTMLDHNKKLHMITRDWVGIQNTAWWDIGKSYTYISKEGTKFQNTFEVGSYITHQKDSRIIFEFYHFIPIYKTNMIIRIFRKD